MNLSGNAYNYLKSLYRDKHWVVSDRHEIVEYLTQQKIPLFDKIIEFQINFSGLELTIAGKPGSTFKASLFSGKDVLAKTQAEVEHINGRFYFYCGNHATAQFWFLICDNGNIGTYNNVDQTVNTIYSSFERFIEEYAYSDLLARMGKHEFLSFFELVDNKGFELLTQNYSRLEDQSDDYNTWLSYNNLIVKRGTWLDKSSSYIHIYGDDAKQCEAFVQLLKDKEIVA